MLTTFRIPSPVHPTPTRAAGDDAPAVDLPYPAIEFVDGAHRYRDESFDSVREALAAVMVDPAFVEAVERKRAIEGLAEGRWFDAAAEESVPSAIDGSQLTERKIAEMVRNLAGESTAIPIDGGGVSEVHETTWNSGAKAAGWVFAGVKSVDEDGRSHLWLYGALLPDVEDAVESKSLQYGSIAWDEMPDRYTGEDIGARLHSYALTNSPFIDGLEPHASRKLRSMGRRLNITPGLERPHERSTPKMDAHTDPAAEATTDTTPNADDAGGERAEGTDLAAFVEGLTDEQRAELVAMLADSGEGDDEEGDRSEGEGADAEREEDAMAEGAVADMLAAAQMANPEITLEAMLAAVKADPEGFAAFFAGGEGTGDGAPAEGGGPRARGAITAAMRALGIESQEDVARLRTMLDEHAEQKRELFEREVIDFANARLEGRADALTDEDRKTYVETARAVRDAQADPKAAAEAWQRTIRTMCGARQSPPSGEAMPDGSSARSRAYGTAADAIKACREEVAAEDKTLKRTDVHAKGYALAKKRYPHLFEQR